jgi:copper chaperone CopZ
MKNIIFIALAATVLLTQVSCAQQIKNAQTDTVKIYGNCGMCEKNIETAAFQKGVSKADWNVDTKMATLTFDGNKTNADEVLRRIATAGYDSDKYAAPDAVFAKLHTCCQYERPVNAETTTATTAEVAKPVTETPATETPAVVPPIVAEKPAQPVKVTATAQPNPDQLKIQLGEVLNAYYAVKNALVGDDSKTASAKAKELLTALEKVDMANFSEEQHGVFMPLDDKIKSDAEHISTVKDIAKQRDRFDTLSDNVFKVVKAFNVNAEPAYQQFCPMAREGKGAYWISKEKGVKNPYYGKSMLTCGKVTETLK